MTLLEYKILTCATDLEPAPYQRQKLQGLIDCGVEWDHLINMAIKEGLAGLLYRNLTNAGVLEALSQGQRERLEGFYYQTLVFNLRVTNELKEVLRVLNQREVPVVLLQGIALLGEIYGDIGLRPMTDIDLWVLPKDYKRLTGVVTTLGYKGDNGYPNIFKKGPITMDFHRHILWADRIKARKLLLAKDQEHIYRDTRIVRFEGEKVLKLSPQDQVLYLSLHAMKHRLNRLIWLVDIKSILVDWPYSAWERLIHRAVELDQEKILSHILFVLRQLFDFQLPWKDHQFLEKNRLNFLEKKILRGRMKRDSIPIWAPVLLLSTGKGVRERFTIFRETLFPRPEILRQMYGVSNNLKDWQLYWIRILQIFGMMRGSLGQNSWVHLGRMDRKAAGVMQRRVSYLSRREAAGVFSAGSWRDDSSWDRPSR